jgi:ubiquinone/menaquinone biosynthesis C-methylase UbiE
MAYQQSDARTGKAIVSKPNYTSIVETAATRITREALAMQLSRYEFAGALCEGKDLLEVGCGSGSGLGYFERRGARKVVGGDYTQNLVVQAAHHYRARVGLLRLDAHALPFQGESFDLVVLFEAIYYLNNTRAFLSEARRVLRPSGRLAICTINREWQDFYPSPFSTRYPSALELAEMLESSAFEPQLYGGFPAGPAGLHAKLLSILKRAAVRLNLIPKTMRSKESLKRMFLGPLHFAPHELSLAAKTAERPEILTDLAEAAQFKVIYALGTKQNAPYEHGNRRS